MIVGFLLFLGILMLYIGAEGLILGSVAIAKSLRISHFVIGLTIIGYGTSVPELFISSLASIESKGDIAIGNIIGSNICNMGLIIGVAGVLYPIKYHPKPIQANLFILIIGNIAFYLLSLNNVISRMDGFLLLLGFAAYTIYLIKSSQKYELFEEEEIIPIQEIRILKRNWGKLLFVTGGIAVLLLGAQIFLSASIEISKILGLYEGVIGLTIVAIGSNLPELATTIAASRRRHSHIVLGNAIGSCLCNIFAVLGISASISPIHFEQIQHSDFYVMIAFPLALYGWIIYSNIIKRTTGAVLLFFYFLYLGWLLI